MFSPIKYLALLVCIVITTAAHAEYDPETGTEKACVAYQRADGTWSHDYKVRGLIVEGSDLYSFAIANGYSANYIIGNKYFVIPWEQGGYTALKLQYSDLPLFTNTTKDQHDRAWKLKDGWSFCN